MNDDIIREIFSDSNGNLTNSWKSKLTEDIKQYLNNRFVEKSRSIKEDIIRIFYGFEQIPKCQICGDLCYLNGGWIKEKIYKIHCNRKPCYTKLNIIHGKQTCLQRYGDENYRNIDKAKQTCLDKYGVEFTFQSEQVIQKIKKTKLDKYGDEYYNNIEKNKQTCLQKYGVQNVYQVESIKQKIKKTKLDKYGDSNYTNREKFKETCNKKYGGCGNKSNLIKEKAEQTCLDRYGYKSILAYEPMTKQRINTCLKKYGVKSYTQTKAYKEYIRQPEVQQIRRIKEYQTKKRNGTLGGPHSKMEEESYKLIKEKYNDVCRQYIDDRYPFACDFYIPSLDLFIECQYYPTHGKHPYDPNNVDDIKYAKYLSETKFGNHTWTIRDPNKRQIAKENHINLLEIWSINELKTWLSKE